MVTAMFSLRNSWLLALHRVILARRGPSGDAAPDQPAEHRQQQREQDEADGPAFQGRRAHVARVSP